LGGTPQQEIACGTGRAFFGLISEGLGLLVEALLESLIVLGARTLIHDAVPFHLRKAERNPGVLVSSKMPVEILPQELTKRESFFEGRPDFLCTPSSQEN
jgi:hypothetical protein